MCKMFILTFKCVSEAVLCRMRGWFQDTRTATVQALDAALISLTIVPTHKTNTLTTLSLDENQKKESHTHTPPFYTKHTCIQTHSCSNTHIKHTLQDKSDIVTVEPKSEREEGSTQ